jgi:outer membrane protein assembly factor BamB
MNINFTKIQKLESESWSTPAFCSISNSLILCDRSGFVYCIDINTNKQSWRINLGNKITASPILADINSNNSNEIFIGTEDSGNLYCVDINGKIIWKQNCGFSIRSTVRVVKNKIIDKTYIIVAGYGNYLHKLDGLNGQLIWKKFIGRHLYSGACGVVSSPLVEDVDNDGRLEVVIGTRNKMVVCLDFYSGKYKWFYPIKSDPDSSPVFKKVGNINYIIIGGGEFVNGLGDLSIHAINGKTGKRIWKKKISGGLDSCPVIEDIDNNGKYEVVITSLADHSCYAFDLISGNIVWQYVFEKAENCVHKKNICFTKDLYRTGDAVCRSYTTPLLYMRQNKIFSIWVGSNNGKIIEIDGKNGKAINTINNDKLVRSSIIGLNSGNDKFLIYVSGNDVNKIKIKTDKQNLKNQFLSNKIINEDIIIKKFNYNFFHFKEILKFYFFLIVTDFFYWIFNVIDVRFKLPFKFLTKNKINRV